MGTISKLYQMNSNGSLNEHSIGSSETSSAASSVEFINSDNLYVEKHSNGVVDIYHQFIYSTNRVDEDGFYSLDFKVDGISDYIQTIKKVSVVSHNPSFNHPSCTGDISSGVFQLLGRYFALIGEGGNVSTDVTFTVHFNGYWKEVTSGSTEEPEVEVPEEPEIEKPVNPEGEFPVEGFDGETQNDIIAAAESLDMVSYNGNTYHVVAIDENKDHYPEGQSDASTTIAALLIEANPTEIYQFDEYGGDTWSGSTYQWYIDMDREFHETTLRTKITTVGYDGSADVENYGRAFPLSSDEITKYISVANRSVLGASSQVWLRNAASPQLVWTLDTSGNVSMPMVTTTSLLSRSAMWVDIGRNDEDDNVTGSPDETPDEPQVEVPDEPVVVPDVWITADNLYSYPNGSWVDIAGDSVDLNIGLQNVSVFNNYAVQYTWRPHFVGLVAGEKDSTVMGIELTGYDLSKYNSSSFVSAKEAVYIDAWMQNLENVSAWQDKLGVSRDTLVMYVDVYCPELDRTQTFFVGNYNITQSVYESLDSKTSATNWNISFN